MHPKVKGIAYSVFFGIISLLVIGTIGLVNISPLSTIAFGGIIGLVTGGINTMTKSHITTGVFTAVIAAWAFFLLAPVFGGYANISNLYALTYFSVIFGLIGTASGFGYKLGVR